MEEIVEREPILQLVHRKDTYKIIIPEEVERKIRLLCNNIWNVEWSGVLFYRVEGSFEDKSLAIRCVDLFQMDEGSSGYTEFNMSPDVVTYMCDHPELLEEGIYQGLIHSHNNMETFFSPTDTSTLSAEGNDMAHFVSLIVNNAGKYTAAVTRKYRCAQKIVEEFKYPTWNGEEKTGSEEFEIEEEMLEWFNLDIEFEKSKFDYEDEMLRRIKSIRSTKSTTFRTGYSKETHMQSSQCEKKETEYHSSFPVEAGRANIETKKQGELPFEDGDYEIPYGIVRIKEEIVDTVVRQLITASIIIPNESAIDVTKWAASMEKLYRTRFGTVKNFENFASSYVDYIINSTVDEEAMNVLDVTEMAAVLAYDVRKELNKFPKNPWLSVYIKMLDDYIL